MRVYLSILFVIGLSYLSTGQSLVNDSKEESKLTKTLSPERQAILEREKVAFDAENEKVLLESELRKKEKHQQHSVAPLPSSTPMPLNTSDDRSKEAKRRQEIDQLRKDK